jgi:hypothetical protein
MPLLLRSEENSQRLFFAYYQPRITLKTLSEKAAPPVASQSTKQSSCPSTSINGNDFCIIGVFVRWPGKNAEHYFFLDFFVTFFVKKKSKESPGQARDDIEESLQFCKGCETTISEKGYQ